MAVEEKQIPRADEGTEIERKSQVVFRRGIADCRKAHQIGEDRVVVLAAHDPEPGIWKSWVKVVPLRALTVMHRTVKLIAGPRADAGGAVGSDIGRVDDAKWRVQSQSAGERFSPVAQMARETVSCRHQILTATKLRRIGRRIAYRLGQLSLRGGRGAGMRRHLADRKTGDAEDRCSGADEDRDSRRGEAAHRLTLSPL